MSGLYCSDVRGSVGTVAQIMERHGVSRRTVFRMKARAKEIDAKREAGQELTPAELAIDIRPGNRPERAVEAPEGPVEPSLVVVEPPEPEKAPEPVSSSSDEGMPFWELARVMGIIR